MKNIYFVKEPFNEYFKGNSLKILEDYFLPTEYIKDLVTQKVIKIDSCGYRLTFAGKEICVITYEDFKYKFSEMAGKVLNDYLKRKENDEK